jgi:hypothetical protein
VNVLPCPGVLLSLISPPSIWAISRLIASPRPVPPYLRLVLPSACWNASKMICCFSGGMPMPVSLTDIAITPRALFRLSLSGDQPSVTGRTSIDTRPRSVNLNALDSRFFRICWSRLASVCIERPTFGATSTSNASRLLSATWRNVRST